LGETYSINPKIIKKIKGLDEPEEFKSLLLQLLEFEKLQVYLGEKEYTRKYDLLISEYITRVLQHGKSNT